METGKKSKSGGGARKIGRNVTACKRYRLRVGRPRGPGVDGCKSGPRWIAR